MIPSHAISTVAHSALIVLLSTTFILYCPSPYNIHLHTAVTHSALIVLLFVAHSALIVPLFVAHPVRLCVSL